MADEVLPGMPAAPEPQDVLVTSPPPTSFSGDTGKLSVGPQMVAEPYEVPGVIIGSPQWNRITKRLKDIKHDWSAAFLGAAFTALGICGSCAVAAWTIPEQRSATARRAQIAGISQGTHAGAVIAAVASAVLFVVCLAAYFVTHTGVKDICADIREEMLVNSGPAH